MNFDHQLLRQKLLQLTRIFFENQNFNEVDTPVLNTQLPLEQNIYSLNTVWRQHHTNFYLQTSPESALKQLISQGFGNCFTLAKCFRDLENTGPTHNLEFTMLEWYQLNADYHQIADLTQNYINYVLSRLSAKTDKRVNNLLTYQSQTIDLTPPWPRVTLAQLFANQAHINLADFLQSPSFNEPDFNQIFLNAIEPHLPQNQPLFIFDYPTILSPLAKKIPGSPFSQRFELYLGGMEIANGCTEQTDAASLQQSFDQELAYRQANHLPLHPTTPKLVDKLTRLPPCSGVGLGVDRLAMLAADASHIRDVLFFATDSLTDQENSLLQSTS